MFKKLLSNLPFNPSLIGEVSFYAKRIRSEESVRRTGLVFMVLAMLIQMFAVISPPEPTLADSSNDVIHGGFSSRDQAVNYCRSNTQDFKNILAHYQLTCDHIANSSTEYIKSTAHNKQLHSMGRNPHGKTIKRTGKPTGEYGVKINGTTYYMRNLWSWDSGSHSTYKMLVTKNRQGQTIMIMYNCGNIVTIGKYTPPPPPKPPKPQEPPQDACPELEGLQYTKEECDVCPNIPGIQTNKNECYPCPEAEDDDSAIACLEMSKSAANQTQGITNADGTLALANDVITYTLTVTNKGSQPVPGFVMEENLNDVLEYSEVVSLDGGDLGDQDNIVTWPDINLSPGEKVSKEITVKVKDPIPQTPVSASDPGSYDLVMTNVFYGNSINIELPPNIIKTTERTVKELPATGPGTTLITGFAVTAVASYFFARSKLLRHELEIVKNDFTSSGGL